MTRRRPASTGERAAAVRSDHGTMTVELVLLTPLLFALLAFLVGLGRAADARGRLTGAVRDAARAASLATSPGAAAQAARDTALANLTGAGLECHQPRISTDTHRFVPGGQVSVTITCTLDLSQLVISGLPGRTALRATATVPLDTYSSRLTTAGGTP